MVKYVQRKGGAAGDKANQCDMLPLDPARGRAIAPSEVFDKVKDAVVVVKTLDAQGKVMARGSGVLISSGRVATNCHVVEGGASYQVGRGKEFFPAALYAEDGYEDICLLDARVIEGSRSSSARRQASRCGIRSMPSVHRRAWSFSLSDHGRAAPERTATHNSGHGSHHPRFERWRPLRCGRSPRRPHHLLCARRTDLNFAMPAEWIGEVSRPKTHPPESKPPEWVKRFNAFITNWDWRRLDRWCRKWDGRKRTGNAEAWFSLRVAYKGYSTDTTTPSRPITRPSGLIRSTPMPGTTLQLITTFPATRRPPWMPSRNCDASIQTGRRAFIRIVLR